MRRKATIIGILAILLTAATAGNAPAYERAVSSVRSFQRSFGDLQKADSMSPIERFVFSLVLSNSKTPTAAANSYAPTPAAAKRRKNAPDPEGTPVAAPIRAATVRSCEEMRPQAGVGRLKPAPPLQAHELQWWGML